MRIRELSHSVYQIRYHIVWGTKYPILYIHEINTGEDHVHMLIEIPPTEKISSVVQKLKGSASIYLKKKFKFIDRIYKYGNLWSVGYFVSTVGLNEEQIRKYIQRQNKYDIGQDVSREFS